MKIGNAAWRSMSTAAPDRETITGLMVSKYASVRMAGVGDIGGEWQTQGQGHFRVANPLILLEYWIREAESQL
jgi:hypothetical protein